MTTRYFYIFLLLLFTLNGHGQNREVVRGLENNMEYRELIFKENQLFTKEDSLLRAITDVRSLYRTERDRREELAAEILRLEGEVFDVRSETGIVAGRISEIEQALITSSLNTSGEERPSGRVTDNDNRGPFIELLRYELPRDDYQDYLAAKQRESTVNNKIMQFLANYRELRQLETIYGMAGTADEADSLYGIYRELKKDGRELADDVSTDWDFIFETKSYAYNFFLQKRNDRTLSDNFSSGLTQLRELNASLAGSTESEEVSRYFNSKRTILQFEYDLAAKYGTPNDRDSITRAMANIERLVTDLPPIDIEERLFLDFDDINFGSTTIYNQKNPIPETVIYPKGKIYRILLGSYQRPQAANIFKGAYPLSVMKSGDGRYNYYAGGYPSFQKAREAAELCSSKGFRNPRIACWENGRYNVVETDATGVYFIRMELTEGNNLPQVTRDLIRSRSPGKDIIRTGNNFTIGPYDTETEAVILKEDIENSDRTVRATIIESSGEE